MNGRTIKPDELSEMLMSTLIEFGLGHKVKELESDYEQAIKEIAAAFGSNAVSYETMAMATGCLRNELDCLRATRLRAQERAGVDDAKQR